jgi:hypothetical protein
LFIDTFHRNSLEIAAHGELGYKQAQAEGGFKADEMRR